MNIVLLCRKYYPSVGGIETSIFQLSKSFSKQGHKVIIITTSAKPLVERKEYADIIYMKQHQSKWLSLLPPFYLLLLKKELREVYHVCEEADIIIGRDTFMTLQACNFFNKIVLYIPSMDVKSFLHTRVRRSTNIKDFILKLLETWQFKIEISNQKKVLNKVHRNIVFCEGMRKQLQESYGVNENNIVVCYPGCSFKNTDIDETKSSGEVLNLLYVGRISPEKNLMMLMEALIMATEKIHLTIVGDGTGIVQLIKKCKELPSNVTVSFEGRQEKPIRYYKKTDYFIFPSKYESFGQVIIESFTCGVPVIGFASISGKTKTAIEELVIDGKTGIICRDFSAAALASCISIAYRNNRNKTKSQMMRESCLHFATTKCNWDNLANTCLRIAETDYFNM